MSIENIYSVASKNLNNIATIADNAPNVNNTNIFLFNSTNDDNYYTQYNFNTDIDHITQFNIDGSKGYVFKINKNLQNMINQMKIEQKITYTTLFLQLQIALNPISYMDDNGEYIENERRIHERELGNMYITFKPKSSTGGGGGNNIP